MATELQKKVARLCGVDVEGKSKRSAAASLRLALGDEILDIFPEKQTSESQEILAGQLGIKDLSPLLEIAALQIDAELIRLNEEAMAEYGFEPGMRVRFLGGPNVFGLAYEVGEEYVISKVKPNGRIYFKQSNGASAYANQLEPVA